MIRRLLAALLVVSGSGLVLFGASADAADVVATAWWSRTATTDPLDESPQPLPFPRPTTPDTVPIGATIGAEQLLVEGIPDGATAVAAIRWVLAEGESSPTLTLSVSPGSTVGPSSLILACRAGTSWESPQDAPGRWEAKPVVDGRACINGIVADDLSSVAFGLQPLVRKQVLDIVLVPGRMAEVPQLPAGRTDGSTFRWIFDAPTPDSLSTVENSGFMEGSGSVVVAPPPASQPVVDTPPATASDSLPSTAPAAPAQPPVSTPAGGTSTVVTPALEPDELAAAFPSQQVQLASDGDDAPRNVGVILLLMGAAWAAWIHLSPEPETTMMGLGRFRRAVAIAPGAAPPGSGGVGADLAVRPTGGLGRFARPRGEPPVPLG